jgi:hypothetical protein
MRLSVLHREKFHAIGQSHDGPGAGPVDAFDVQKLAPILLGYKLRLIDIVSVFFPSRK